MWLPVYGTERAHEPDDGVLRRRVERLRRERVQTYVRRCADDGAAEARCRVRRVALHVVECEFHGCDGVVSWLTDFVDLSSTSFFTANVISRIHPLGILLNLLLFYCKRHRILNNEKSTKPSS